MIMISKYLPYKIRDKIDRLKINHHARRSQQLPPRYCASPSKASCEIHVLMGSRDFLIGLAAIHSLVRFIPNASLAISDDGSLSDSQKMLIKDQFIGSRVIPRYSLWPNGESLPNLPHLKRLYHSSYHCSAKLLHPVLLGEHDQIILMDCDTLCLRTPELILNWLNSPANQAYYMHDDISRNAESPELAQVFQELNDRSRENYEMRIKHYFFNSGLLCFNRSKCDLSHAENFLTKRLQIASRYSFPNSEIWLGDWTPEQTSYMTLFENMDCEIQGLGPDYKIGCGNEWRTFHHFLGAGMRTKKVQQQFHDTIELMLQI